MPYRLGVDVGGTFTDLILVDEKSGSIHTAKVPSTPADSSIGVMNGVAKVCDNAGVDPSEIAQVMHGTTVATNTVLTGTGAKVGLVTTKGLSTGTADCALLCARWLGWVGDLQQESASRSAVMHDRGRRADGC